VHIKVEALNPQEIAQAQASLNLSRKDKDEEEEDAAEETAPPTLEELGCTFSLQLLGGSKESSDVLRAAADTDAENTEEAEEKEGEEDEEVAAMASLQARKLLFHGDDGAFYHTFTCEASFPQETATAVCDGSLESSLTLLKEGQEAPLLILPLDLSPFVAAERRVEIWCSLENTELSRAPYNLKGFTVLMCSDRDVLSRSLRKELNPLRITIVHASHMPSRDTSGKLGQTFESMREQCRPAFCRYSFLDTEVETIGMLHAKTLKFKASKVFCIGTRSVQDMEDYLLNNKLHVHIFDRELIPVQRDLEERLGGGEGEDSEEAVGKEGAEGDDGRKSPPPPVWTGLRSIDQARAGEVNVCT